MSFQTKLIVGALTDFAMTGLTAVLAVGHFPDNWGWFVAMAGGTLAAIKHVRGMTLDPKGE